ncbi:GxxExxY protein [Aeoliella sp. SH292]|uniref:GxxExxY protein n=1 Tax=Aeoliella sp. SH292 TaxID=3454464 RepID=UPI003F9D4E7C
MYEPVSSDVEALAKKVLDVAFKVHRSLGPGLLESVYERCICHELRKAGIEFVSQAALPIEYDDLVIDGGLRIDILVGGKLVVELKAVESLLPIHEAQLFTYIKLSHNRLGLLLNFNVPMLKDGIKRIVC